MAVTAFCWPRRSPFIAAAAVPGPRAPPPWRRRPRRRGLRAPRPGEEGRMGGEESPAVIQRPLHVGPRRIGPWTSLPWARPLPPALLSVPDHLSFPRAPSPFLFTFSCILHLSGNIHPKCFLCLVTPAVRAAFLTTPLATFFFFSPLLYSYPHTFLFFCPFSLTFFFTHILCLITSPCFFGISSPSRFKPSLALHSLPPSFRSPFLLDLFPQPFPPYLLPPPPPSSRPSSSLAPCLPLPSPHSLT